MLEIIGMLAGFVFLCGILLLTFKDMKRANLNAENLQRIADSVHSIEHLDCLTDIQLKIIADLVKGRSLDEMRCCYGAEFVDEYDFYNSVANRLHTYLFE